MQKADKGLMISKLIVVYLFSIYPKIISHISLICLTTSSWFYEKNSLNINYNIVALWKNLFAKIRLIIDTVNACKSAFRMLKISKYSERTDRVDRWCGGRKYRKRQRYGRCTEEGIAVEVASGGSRKRLGTRQHARGTSDRGVLRVGLPRSYRCNRLENLRKFTLR